MNTQKEGDSYNESSGLVHILHVGRDEGADCIYYSISGTRVAVLSVAQFAQPAKLLARPNVNTTVADSLP